MALRRSRELLRAPYYYAKESPFSGGLRGFLERLRIALTTGKVLRPYDMYDETKLPASTRAYRTPAPGSQPLPEIPQGPYDKVFDIKYFDRDTRRLRQRASVPSDQFDAAAQQLPPTPGQPYTWTSLGYYGQYVEKQREEYAQQQKHAASSKA